MKESVYFHSVILPFIIQEFTRVYPIKSEKEAKTIDRKSPSHPRQTCLADFSFQPNCWYGNKRHS